VARATRTTFQGLVTVISYLSPPRLSRIFSIVRLSFFTRSRVKERLSLKYTLDIFNLTNTASFDIPIDNVSQNLVFNDFPVFG
jgi:hypothetical protein